ncbi:MAG: hypothetical protein KA419_08500 [Acidobacteria bacterium]|nr:hypothetical protein [Acidobacteriota bacterium]
MHNPETIEELAWRVLDGEATPEEAARLESLSAADPEVDRLRREIGTLATKLRENRDVDIPPDLERGILEALPRPVPWLKRLFGLAGAVRGNGGPATQQGEGGIMPGYNRFPLNRLVVMAAVCSLVASAVVFVTLNYPSVEEWKTMGAIGRRDVYREPQAGLPEGTVQAPNTLNAEAFRRWTRSAEFKSMCGSETYKMLYSRPDAFQSLLQNEAFKDLVLGTQAGGSSLMQNAAFLNLLQSSDFKIVVGSAAFQASVKSAYQSAYGTILTGSSAGFGPTLPQSALQASGQASQAGGSSLQSANQASLGAASALQSNNAAAFGPIIFSQLQSANKSSFGPIVLSALQNVLQSADFQGLLQVKAFQDILANSAFAQLMNNQAFGIVLSNLQSFESLASNAAFKSLLGSENLQALLCGQAFLSTFQNNADFKNLSGSADFQALAKSADFQAVMKSAEFQSTYGPTFLSLLGSQDFGAMLKSQAFQSYGSAFFSQLAANPTFLSLLQSQSFAALANAGMQAGNLGNLWENAAFQSLLKSGPFQALGQNQSFESFVKSEAFQAMLGNSPLLQLCSHPSFAGLVASGSFGALAGSSSFLSLCKNAAFFSVLQSAPFQNLMQNAPCAAMLQNGAFLSTLGSFGPAAFLSTLNNSAQTQAAFGSL